jgi:hypothetical protein
LIQPLPISQPTFAFGKRVILSSTLLLLIILSLNFYFNIDTYSLSSETEPNNCVSPYDKIATPLSPLVATYVNDQPITSSDTTYDDLSLQYGDSANVQRLWVVNTQVKLCDEVIIRPEFAHTNITNFVNDISPKQKLDIYQNLNSGLNISARLCHLDENNRSSDNCIETQYEQINQYLDFGKKYQLSLTLTDKSNIIRIDDIYLQTLGYMQLNPTQDLNNVGYKEALHFQANQSVEQCSSLLADIHVPKTLKINTDNIEAFISTIDTIYDNIIPTTLTTNTDNSLTVNPTTPLAFNTDYALKLKCQNSISQTTNTLEYKLHVNPQLELISYSPEYSYEQATICLTFNNKIDRGFEEIALDGVKGKFNKNADNIFCSTVSNPGSKKTYQVIVPNSLESAQAGKIIKSYEKQTIVDNNPVKTVLLPARLHFQEQATTCVLASVKMALSALDINVSENQIYEKMGQAMPIEHQCSGGAKATQNGSTWSCPKGQQLIWGDWNQGFVGNRYGRFGIAEGTETTVSGLRAAQAWAPNSYNATGSDPIRLLQEVGNNNPVIYSQDTQPSKFRYCWQTPNGNKLCSTGVKHAKVLVGYSFDARTGTYYNIKVYDSVYGILTYSFNAWVNDYNSNGKKAIVIKK